MKTRRQVALLVSFVLLPLLLQTVSGAMYSQSYYGNGVQPTTEIVSEGTLTMSGSAGGAINVNFTRGGVDNGAMNYNLVLFLDTTSGGFNNTGGFNDYSGPMQSAISGYDGSHRGVATFANGFYADYAVVISANYGAYLFQLGTASHERLDPRLCPPGDNPAQRTYTFSLNRDTLGLAPSGVLRFQSGYLTDYGRRTLESFEQLNGPSGYAPVTYDNYNVFDINAVPEPTSIALPIFGGLAGLFLIGSRLRRRLSAG